MASSPLTSALWTPAPTSLPRATGTALPAPAGLILAIRASIELLGASTVISCDLYGDSAIYDMEIFQEGGPAGDVPVPAAARKVQEALMRAHPGALWMLLGWQQNPTQELLSSIDTSHVLVAEIEQGRIPRDVRDHEFRGAPRGSMAACGSLADRTTMGSAAL